MKQRDYHVAIPATLFFVMMAFTATIIFANGNLSFAASGDKKLSVVERTSAVDHAEARILQLQGVLKITNDQKEIWNNLTKVMRASAKEMDTLINNRDENANTMNAVEHMKFHSQINAAHSVQLNKFIPLFEALYAIMSDEQKKSTDKLLRTELVWQNWTGA